MSYELANVAKVARTRTAADRSQRAKWRHKQVGGGSGTGEGLKVIACPGCWCGDKFGHPWPGKDDGAPHPR